MNHCFTATAEKAVPIVVLAEDEWASYHLALDDRSKRWLAQHNFAPQNKQFCIIPNEHGDLSRVVVIADRNDMWSLAPLVSNLPPLTFCIEGIEDSETLLQHYFAWGAHCYRFDRYKKNQIEWPQLLLTDKIDKARLRAFISSTFLVRDLINTPASDMKPEHLSRAMREVADEFKANFSEIVGEELLAQNFPMIYAVGKASESAPRLLEMLWGDKKAPRITLVGKGVCFDTGGLNLKPTAAMRIMKKDMAGAAHVIGLASLMMSLKLPYQIRVLVPAVENSVSANAYRPGDVLVARNGKSVEVGNTDAEGRLVLADALSYATEQPSEYLLDFSTLTGAARVAVGTDISAMFSNNDDLAEKLLSASVRAQDPVWRLPLYSGYQKFLDSTIADISNDPSTGLGGAITAGLFLQSFIGEHLNWIHFDMMAWNLSSTAGHPEGGEAMALRATCEMFENKQRKA